MKFFNTILVVLLVLGVATASEEEQQQSLRGLKKIWTGRPGKSNPGGNGKGNACGTYKGVFLEDCPAEEGAGCAICASPGKKPKLKCVGLDDRDDPEKCLAKPPKI
mmetsp:Transcript_32350/g.78936  ORF Transcript_32350/g.78936 Transcript_32350/m.78936 type:complete len:106 (+) Transcript_32350:161-478(+)